MKNLSPLVTLIVAWVAPAGATPQTVTLSVPGMSCAACPITVKKALNKVPGVSKAEVSFKTREAVVSFDDAKATLKALTQATADAGFPSTAKQ